MAMTVLSLMVRQGGDIYYSSTWRLLVETHLTWLRARNESEIVLIEPHVGYKYEGDFYGALTECRIPDFMHYTVMRMNGLYSPVHYDGQSVAIMVPTRETLSQLASIAATTQKKIA